MAGICGIYWIASLPLVADELGAGFGRVPRTSIALSCLKGVQAVVVLGAGAVSYQAGGDAITVPLTGTALNALEGARIDRLLNGTIPIVASGGVATGADLLEPEAAVIRRLLVDRGVAPEHIVLESQSRTTHEQAHEVSRMLKARGWQRIALVTSPVHLLRAVGAFAVEGVDVVPAPALFASDRSPRSRRRWQPSQDGLDRSLTAIYDDVALVYYWMRGWVKLR